MNPLILLLCLTTTAEPALLTDSDRTLMARDMFFADSRLRPRHLGAQVENGVATIWGPVTTQDMADHAERLVRTVPGIREVRNDCHVVPRPDPAVERVGKIVRGEVPPSLLTFEPQPLVAEPVRVPPVQSVSLKNPVRAVVKAEPPAIAKVSLLPKVNEVRPVPMSRVEDLPMRLNRVLRTDRRFDRLSLQVTDTDVRVTGTVAKATWMWDVAELLADAATTHKIDVSRVGTSRR